MNRVRWMSRLLAVLVVIAPFAAARPASALGGNYTFKVPGVVPLVTVLASQPLALTTNALGAPGQPPVKTDTLLVNSVEPVFAAKRNVRLKPGGAQAQYQPPECEDYGAHGWFYDISGNKKYQFVQGNNQSTSRINDTSGKMILTVSSSSGGSVKVSAEASMEVSADVIVSSVKYKFGLSVTRSVDWSNTETTSIEVPPHSRMIASYGVTRVVTTGHYYFKNKNCEVTIDKGIIETATPYVWTLWARNY